MEVVCPNCSFVIDPDVAEPANTVEIETEYDQQDRLERWTETTRDNEDAQVSKRQDEYTYYAGGEVHKIEQKQWDAEDTLVYHREVEHYLDGAPPAVEIFEV